MGEAERSGLLLQDGAEVESGGRRFVIMQLLEPRNSLIYKKRDGAKGGGTLRG